MSPTLALDSRIQQLLDMERGWDEHDAEPLSRAAAEKAQEAFDRLLTTLGRPGIFAHAELLKETDTSTTSGFLLEWVVVNEYLISLEIFPEDVYTSYYQDFTSSKPQSFYGEHTRFEDACAMIEHYAKAAIT